MSIATHYLREHGVEFEPVLHPRALSAVEEAKALGIDPDDVVKTIVLRGADGYVLAVIPASRRLNMRDVRFAVGAGARLATEEEITKDLPGYELGAVPPIGGLLGIPMLVDPEVATKQAIVFAGSQTMSIQMRVSELLHDPTVKIATLTSDHENHDEIYDA